MKETVWILKKLFRFCFKYIMGLIAIMLLTTVIAVGGNAMNKLMLDELFADVAKGSLSVAFYFAIAGYVTFWILKSLIGYLQAFSNNLFRLKIDVFMQRIFMKKSNDINQEQFFRPEFLDRHAFLSENTYKASNFVFKLATIIFNNIFSVISAIVVFVMYEPLLVIYLGIVVVVNVISTAIISKKQYEISRTQITEERYTSYFKNSCMQKNMAKDQRIFGYGAKLIGKWKNVNRKYQEKRMKVMNQVDSCNNVAQVITYILKAAFDIILLFSVQNKMCTVGTFVMLIGMMELATQNIKGLITVFVQGAFDEARYFKEYYEYVYPFTDEDVKQMLEEGKGNVTDKKKEFCSLVVKNVSYTYPNSPAPAVNDVSFEVKKGEIVSILGYNGSGKTTLSKLMYGGLKNAGGTILINGRDIHEMVPEERFRYFGVASQEFSIHALSVKENVCIGCVEDMSDELCKKAYEQADLQSVLDKLPNGEDTIISKAYDNDGIELSGGEKQKVLLAATYMGDPEILLMDEPTASVDPMKEYEMLKNLRKVLNGRTAVLISHRIGFARLADRIIVMENGRIAEEGRHEDLIQNDGLYARIFQGQKELYTYAKEV